MNMPHAPAGAYAYHLQIVSSDGMAVTEALGGDYCRAAAVTDSLIRRFLLDGFVASSSPLQPTLMRFIKRGETLSLSLMVIGAN
ncbi:MAG: hypothetical protein K8L97_01555 [Anaerolineae bacterium]|nr:hypothetical protein [Anaerolineae bacterium]